SNAAATRDTLVAARLLSQRVFFQKIVVCLFVCLLFCGFFFFFFAQKTFAKQCLRTFAPSFFFISALLMSRSSWQRARKKGSLQQISLRVVLWPTSLLCLFVCVCVCARAGDAATWWYE